MISRRAIAQFLLRRAIRIDPSILRRNDPQPLEFITTEELAQEIQRRTDVSVTLYGFIVKGKDFWSSKDSRLLFRIPVGVEASFVVQCILDGMEEYL